MIVCYALTAVRILIVPFLDLTNLFRLSLPATWIFLIAMASGWTFGVGRLLQPWQWSLPYAALLAGAFVWVAQQVTVTCVAFAIFVLLQIPLLLRGSPSAPTS